MFQSYIWEFGVMDVNCQHNTFSLHLVNQSLRLCTAVFG